MKRKPPETVIAEEELFVDVTFHGLPADLLKEFVETVSNPFYSGSLASSIKALMQEAIMDQQFLKHTFSKTEKRY